jgi:predicted Zn-dependent protease
MSNWELRGKSGRGFYRCTQALRGWGLVLLALLAVGAPSCQTVSVTGRKQFNRYSIADDKQLGGEVYNEHLKGAKLLSSGPQYAQVKRVVERLIPAVDDPGFDWEFRVIDDPETVNAWCLPGGKMAVYTGILPVTQDDAGLAVVMGHEIAHAVARHGTERASSQEIVGVGVGLAAMKVTALSEYQQAVGVFLDLFAFKPWGRNHELEADHIGLMYMARAGYDPRAAPEFWRRMSALSSGQAPPEFLSTHPSDARRIAEIEKLLPEALKVYATATGGGAPKP